LRSASNEDGNPSESILEAFNKSGDLEDCDGKGYDSDEYDAAMKKFEAELASGGIRREARCIQTGVHDQQRR
jgi:hypothetical protein